MPPTASTSPPPRASRSTTTSGTGWRRRWRPRRAERRPTLADERLAHPAVGAASDTPGGSTRFRRWRVRRSGEGGARAAPRTGEEPLRGEPDLALPVLRRRAAVRAAAVHRRPHRGRRRVPRVVLRRLRRRAAERRRGRRRRRPGAPRGLSRDPSSPPFAGSGWSRDGARAGSLQGAVPWPGAITLG